MTHQRNEAKRNRQRVADTAIRTKDNNELVSVVSVDNVWIKPFGVCTFTPQACTISDGEVLEDSRGRGSFQ